MSKKKLIEECKVLILNESQDGGVSDHDDFNNMATDLIPELLPYLSMEGLIHLKEKLKELNKDIIASSERKIEFFKRTQPTGGRFSKRTNKEI